MLHRMILAPLALLVGCSAAPTRVANPDAFKLVFSGHIKPGSMQAMTDCVMDGFDSATLVGTQGITVRQQRRVGGYRVEAMGGPVLFVSADISESGKVTMHEGTYVGTVATFEKELAAITACEAKFR